MHCSRACLRDTAGSCPRARCRSSRVAYRSGSGRRLQGLAASHDVLVRNSWQGVPLADLMRQQLMPFIDIQSSRVELTGPDIFVTAEATQSPESLAHLHIRLRPFLPAWGVAPDFALSLTGWGAFQVSNPFHLPRLCRCLNFERSGCAHLDILHRPLVSECQRVERPWRGMPRTATGPFLARVCCALLLVLT
jgi:HWE histidine kinase